MSCAWECLSSYVEETREEQKGSYCSIKIFYYMQYFLLNSLFIMVWRGFWQLSISSSLERYLSLNTHIKKKAAFLCQLSGTMLHQFLPPLLCFPRLFLTDLLTIFQAFIDHGNPLLFYDHELYLDFCEWKWCVGESKIFLQGRQECKGAKRLKAPVLSSSAHHNKWWAVRSENTLLFQWFYAPGLK